MVWNVTEAIEALKIDPVTPAAVRNELNRMRAGREDRLSVKTKAYIAQHGIDNNERDYNDTLWMNQNISPLNRLLRSKQYSAVVSRLYDRLDPMAREAISNRGANIRLYFNLTTVLSRSNKKTRYTRCEELISLINEDPYLVSIMLSTHADLRKAFMHLLTDSAFLQFKPLLNFVLSHAELAADLKTQLKFIIDNEQQPKETRATLFLREHLSFGVGDGFLPRAIRDNPQYFTDSPEIYTGLLQFNKKQTESILAESTHFGWKLANALKFLLPNFVRVAFNIEPPLKRVELTRLRELHDSKMKPVAKSKDMSKDMPGSPYHLDELRAITREALAQKTPQKKPADNVTTEQIPLNEVSSVRAPHISLSVVSSDESSVRPPHQSLDDVSSLRDAHHSLDEISSVHHAQSSPPNSSLGNVSAVRNANNSLDNVSSIQNANNSLNQVSPVREAHQSLDEISPPRQVRTSDQDSDDDVESFSPLMQELAQPRPPSKQASAVNSTFGSRLDLDDGLIAAGADFIDSPPSQNKGSVIVINPATGLRFSDIPKKPSSFHY